MDLFEHRYYRLSKRIMTLLGQWPYQSTRSRYGFIAVSIFLATTGSVPQLLAYLKYRDDRRKVLESVILCLFATISTIKFIGIMWNSDKTLMLLNRICMNWRVWARDQEVNILHKYAKQGEQIIIVYTDLSILPTATIYLNVIVFTTQPIIPKIVDVILKNGTEPGKFPYPVDYYYFDAQKYYCYVMMHFYICACVAVMPLVARDSMLIIYVQHVCGLFAALGRKSQKIGNNDTSVENVVHLSSFIERHNDSIEYVNLIDATYTWDFFFVIGLGMILLNVLGLQILIGTNDSESIIRFIFVVSALIFIFYMDCYICQIVMDHSINVGFYIYNSQWYRLVPRDQKLLQLMIMRCHVPCQVTAGKMLIMSLRNFGMTFRTAISYFAVIRSMDDELNIA